MSLFILRLNLIFLFYGSLFNRVLLTPVYYPSFLPQSKWVKPWFSQNTRHWGKNCMFWINLGYMNPFSHSDIVPCAEKYIKIKSFISTSGYASSCSPLPFLTCSTGISSLKTNFCLRYIPFCATENYLNVFNEQLISINGVHLDFQKHLQIYFYFYFLLFEKEYILTLLHFGPN